MLFSNHRENYVPTIENRLRQMRRDKIKAWAFWLACIAAALATAYDLFVRSAA